ncbi:MAG: CDC27 family protein [Acidobacteria bacterium]|nr:CDC27 family protein [Acidobacteriota bacterium]
MRNVATLLTIFLMVPLYASATPCNEKEGYAKGVCLYSEGEPEAAIGVLDEVITAGNSGPLRPKAMYFKGRSLMKLQRWEEAQKVWIELFSVSPPFYRLWNCDYLLGVCRARGE